MVAHAVQGDSANSRDQSIKHLEENIAAASLELPEAAYDKLSEVSHLTTGLRD